MQSFRHAALVSFRDGPSRRWFVGSLCAAALLALDRFRLLGLPSRAARSVAGHGFRIRTITAGVRLASATDLETVESAISFLERARKVFAGAGYEVQTTRIATEPLVVPVAARARNRALADLQALDRAAGDGKVLVSVGPLLREDVWDPGFPAWAADLIGTTANVNFSVAVASPARGIHHGAAATAAATIAAIGRASAGGGGEGNFRFAAAASCPPGIPFFPAAYHEGPSAFAIGLESAPLVQSAFTGVRDAAAAKARLKALLEAELGVVERIAVGIGRREGRRYLGVDASPAPGKDASIGAAIEALTRVPFGSASTLEACAAVTDVLKTLAVRTCGYSGLMLPVLEDPVLAQRAAEHRFTVRELLLYSSVCGTGLDVVPLPGEIPVDVLAALIRDVAALSVKLRKPLSARLFPVPGKAAGEPVHFANPFLSDSVVMAAN